jgi:hypothetical protein
MMKKVKRVLAGLVLSAVLYSGVIWGANSNQAVVGEMIVKPGHGSVTVAMADLASAAKELDGLTSGGGPTATMNQKIQE